MALREIVTKDVGWKLFSLALAAAIWLTVRPVSQEPLKPGNPLANWKTQTFTILVVPVSSNGNVHSYKINPAAVEVTVKAEPAVLATLAANEIRVTVDLTDLEEPRSLRKRVYVSIPPGMTFDRVMPLYVDIVPTK